MDKDTRIILLKISSLGLLFAGMIFLGLAIFGDDRSSTLILGLCFINIANVFNILRTRQEKKDEE